jgi:hypothetical protein
MLPPKDFCNPAHRFGGIHPAIQEYEHPVFFDC